MLRRAEDSAARRAVLADAVRFTAEQDGEVVFTGVVDEAECGWDSGGGRLELSGRGMAALLLDNEALGSAIAAYIRLFDTALQLFFHLLDQPETAIVRMESLYGDYLRSAPAIL